MVDYWPMESWTEFVVQLASMDQNGNHSFLSSVILGSEAYSVFFVGMRGVQGRGERWGTRRDNSN